MARWEDWQRTRHDPDTPPNQYQQALARKVLGELMEGIKRGGLFQNKIRRTFADGTVVVAQFDGTTPMVQVFNPQSTATTSPPVLTSLWIPRGFVFVAGNDSAPQGWGLPVIPSDEDTTWPFGTANLAPGLDVKRWTVNGPAAQVLLTQDDTTHYPDERRKRLPVGYESAEWKAYMKWEPKQDAWHAVRPTFEGFDWTPDQRGARITLWRACATALTTSKCSLPFAGFYDDAQVYAILIATYGTSESAWPSTYKPSAVRGDKDGHRVGYNEVWSLNGTAAQVAELLSSSNVPLQLNTGVDLGAMTVTLRSEDNWIACGNLFWHPTDPALPTLSWDGYPAQNLPNWLVTGGWVGDTGSDIFPLEGWYYEWRGKTRYIYSKNLYAMGRCIGVLPDTVVAAAIRKETVAVDGEPGTTKHVNRVVVITWRASDQFGNATGIAYLWTFRVWCADFDATPDVPLHLTSVPVGAYDATTNPTGWRACGSFAASPTSDPTAGLNGLPESCLWQAPRFNGDGTKAIAAFGVPPYVADWGPRWAQEWTFTAVASSGLSLTSANAVPTPSGGAIVAVDYDETGAYVWVWSNSSVSIDLPTPEGPEDAVLEMFEWSKGGIGEVTEWSGVGFPVPDKWVLDACDGAMVLTDHWFECPAAQSLHQVRMTRRGTRVATDTIADNANIVVAEYESTSYLDRLNASYVRDRDGNWMMGYDFGVTAGASTVYVSTPVCGQGYPATTGAAASAHFGSRWISNVGDPAAMAKIDDVMRAFPLGVV